MESLLKEKVIFDGYNLYELRLIQKLGYTTYYSICREVAKIRA
jgi:hypothetical protein